MSPLARQFLVFVGCGLLAVWLGIQIADGRYLWPALAGTIALGAILHWLLRLPVDVILCGWLLIGYIVGNRGFAQLMPSPALPLLPAEVGLLVAGGWRVLEAAFTRRLPFRPDALNWALLAWLVAGTARFVFDAPRFGFTAVRDFALVYYAAYFFLVQEMGRDAAARRYLLGCAVAACLLLAPTYAAYSFQPDFFLRQLTIGGTPLIFYKGDLLNTFFALGALLLFFCARGRWQVAGAVASAGFFVHVAGGDNRASLAGLVAASLILLLAGRWRFPLWQGAVAALALLALLGLASSGSSPWAERKVAGLTDRVRSFVDFEGVRAYRSEESGHKGDNNRFRLIWWNKVIEETWQENPVFGRGFGADLAAGFVQEYYPDSDEQFSARSPHNVSLTIFGRMGLVGLALWLIVLAALARRGWHTLRRQDDPAGWALWGSLAIVLVSASFGVVLEGPMGAVPFWILAGLAVARQRALEENPVDTPAAPVPARTPALAARGA